MDPLVCLIGVVAAVGLGVDRYLRVRRIARQILADVNDQKD